MRGDSARRLLPAGGADAGLNFCEVANGAFSVAARGRGELASRFLPCGGELASRLLPCGGEAASKLLPGGGDPVADCSGRAIGLDVRFSAGVGGGRS